MIDDKWKEVETDSNGKPIEPEMPEPEIPEPEMPEPEMPEPPKEKDEEGNDSEYEEICYICRRPEHIVGPMIKIQPNLCICSDCMQRTFDAMNYGNPNDMMNMNFGNMPNISMINLSDFQPQIPNSQRLKKKKTKEKKE